MSPPLRRQFSSLAIIARRNFASDAARLQITVPDMSLSQETRHTSSSANTSCSQGTSLVLDDRASVSSVPPESSNRISPFTTAATKSPPDLPKNQEKTSTLAVTGEITQNSTVTSFSEWLTEKIIDGGYLPHFLLRKCIQHQFRQRAREIASPSFAAAFARKMAFIEDLRKSDIAIHTDTANRQHYELPAGLMAAALGPRMKYSCSLFETGKETLAEAEDAMLASYVDKLGFQDGMSLLDLGCGWGAAVLYFAERFPKSHIVGFSNSRTQREHILRLAAAKNLTNVHAVTGDAVTADLGAALYDRVLSCEMFEHLKNYDGIMTKTARALRPGGQFLLHVFCHRDTPYHFAGGWMAEHFFSGGTMPSADLMMYFARADLRVAGHWWLPGRHYHQTIEAWLANFLRNKEAVWPSLVAVYGEEMASVWFNRWQVYYLACAEMFVSGGGDTYGVTHYLFDKAEWGGRGGARGGALPGKIPEREGELSV